RPRQAPASSVAAGDGRRVLRLGRGVPRARAERLALPTLRVPAPPARLDARPGSSLPARAQRASALADGGRGLRPHVRRARRVPLLRPRRRTGLRSHLAACRTAAPMRRALLIAAFAALSLPAQAFAHATLERTSPSFEQRLSNSPRTVTLRFDQYIERLPYAIQLYSTHGELRVPRIRAHARDLIASVPKLRRGAYTIRWHALSGDGHVVSGLFTFGVRAKAPAPTEAFGASGPTRTEDVVRWFYFLSLALVVGGLGFRLLVARRRLPDRFFALTGVGVFATLNVGIAAFLLRAEDALQLPFGRLLYGDLSPIVGGTRFGQAFIAMTLGFALVAALLYLAWLTDRTVFLWPAFLLGLGFASGLSLSGHSAADGGSSWLSELADWILLSAAALW